VNGFRRLAVLLVLLDPWGWRHHDHLKRREPLTKRRNVTCEKPWIFHVGNILESGGANSGVCYWIAWGLVSSCPCVASSKERGRSKSERRVELWLHAYLTSAKNILGSRLCGPWGRSRSGGKKEVTLPTPSIEPHSSVALLTSPLAPVRLRVGGSKSGPPPVIRQHPSSLNGLETLSFFKRHLRDVDKRQHKPHTSISTSHCSQLQETVI